MKDSIFYFILKYYVKYEHRRFYDRYQPALVHYYAVTLYRQRTTDK